MVILEKPDIFKAKSGDKQEIDKVLAYYDSEIKIIAKKLSVKYLSHRDDLLQEGRLALLSAINSYNPEKGAAFSTFAAICIKRRMIDEIRRITRRNGNTVPLDNMLSTPDDENDIDFKMTKQYLFENIPKVLSDSELKVFFLKMQGNSYNEIAETLNISVKSVDNALKRARSKIHELYSVV